MPPETLPRQRGPFPGSLRHILRGMGISQSAMQRQRSSAGSAAPPVLGETYRQWRYPAAETAAATTTPSQRWLHGYNPLPCPNASPAENSWPEPDLAVPASWPDCNGAASRAIASHLSASEPIAQNSTRVSPPAM